MIAIDAAAKIKTIKEVRTICNLGLKEAKDIVEKLPSVLIKQAVKEDVGSAEHFEYDGELRHERFVRQAARDLIGTVLTKDTGGGTSKEDDGCAEHPEHDAQIGKMQLVRNEFS